MATYDPDAQKKPVPVAEVEKINPNPKAEPLRDIKSDSKLIPRSALISHIEGSEWVVESYYSQYLNKDNNPIEYSLDLPAVSQQYRRINKLELRVQNPLSHSYANGENEFSVTGSAALYPGVIPNVHDVFIADIGDGQFGRFNVTQVTPCMYLAAPAYEIEYKLIARLDRAVKADLEVKTFDTVRYVRDQYLSGNQAFLLEKQAEQYDQIQRILATLPKEYYREFYSKEYCTLLIPDQPFKTYDPFLTGFFKRLVNPEVHPWIRNINELNCDDGNHNVIFTLFDAALENDPSVLDRCYSDIQPTNVIYFTNQALFASVRYSGMEFVMFPANLTVDFNRGITATKGFTLNLGPNIKLNRKVRMDEAYSSTRTQLVPGQDEASVEWVSPKAIKETYIFSPEFYADTVGQSGIELMFRSAVKGEFCDPAQILKACGDRVLWTSTTRFYYVPILLYILQVAVANIG